MTGTRYFPARYRVPASQGALLLRLQGRRSQGDYRSFQTERLQLTDLFDLVGWRRRSYNRNTGQLKLCGADWLVVGAEDEGSERESF